MKSCVHGSHSPVGISRQHLHFFTSPHPIHSVYKIRISRLQQYAGTPTSNHTFLTTIAALTGRKPSRLQAHMNSDLPVSAASKGDGASSSSSTSSWLDILKKLYALLKKLIPLIKACFTMTGASSSSSDAAKSTKDILTQLTNILPTGTFMAFQLIAPLTTNNGVCGATEKIVSATLLCVFAAMIVISSFTDSVKIPSTGKVHYGLVTPKGLWNPAFKGSSIPGVTGAYYTAGGAKFTLRAFDYVNAAMSLAAFAALSLLTDPVAKCYFKSLSSTVQKAVPLIVGAVISFLLSFAPAARNGIGFRLDASTAPPSATHSSLLHGHEPATSTADQA